MSRSLAGFRYWRDSGSKFRFNVWHPGWVTNWVTTGAADAGRPRTMVDSSGSSLRLVAQRIDG
ncbi:hypothetical protein ABZ671_24480 [Micromonospora sp. NPDC006766]|uniref:hypothetical protein n=1 Tax=Micromonospora sp. NPDC006766 TaxID=3154778 RepID=UPI0033EED1A6